MSEITTTDATSLSMTVSEVWNSDVMIIKIQIKIAMF